MTGPLDGIVQDAMNPVNRNLRPFQYQIGSTVFGWHTDIPVSKVDIQTYNVNAQDFQVIRTDERQFGVDTLAPGTITFTMAVLDNGPLPNIAGIALEELPPSLVARQGLILPMLAKEWKANEIRPIWGETKPIYFCDADGITRRIYGRPGKFSYSRRVKHNAWFDVQAEYRRSDTYAHSDDEFFVGPLAPGAPPAYANRQGGDADCWFRVLVFGPVTNPVITYGANTIQVNATIDDGVVMEISSYPWMRRVVDSTGLNWRAFVVGSTMYLDQLIFPAFTSMPISWTIDEGASHSDDTQMLFLWREAYNVV